MAPIIRGGMTSAAILLAALATVGCGGEAPRNGGFVITGPAPTGTIRVSTVTTGGDLDLNGYRLFLDNVVQPSVYLSTAGRALVVAAGQHTVALGDVAANCTVRGQQPREVLVTAGVLTEVLYEVDCFATGVKIVTRITGPDPRTRFTATVASTRGWIGPNDSLVVSRLNRGVYSVVLGNLEAQCRAASGNPVIADVFERTVVTVIFSIICGEPPAKAYGSARLAFVSNGDLMVADSTGSGALLLEHRAPAQGPSWSPDGEKIVFSGTVCDDFYYNECFGGLMLADLAANTVKPIDVARQAIDPDWGSDGVIAYTTVFGASYQYGKQIHLVTGEGSLLARLTMPGVQAASHPSWSPDGKRIAFECYLGESSPPEICVVSPDGSALVRLTENVEFDGSPAWSPDGSSIAFMSFNSNEASIKTMNVDGTGVRRIAAGGSPTWSRDGKKVTFSTPTGLFTIARDGSNLQRLTTGKHGEPAWRP